MRRELQRATSALLAVEPIVLVGRMALIALLVNTRWSPAAMAFAVAGALLLFLEPSRLRSPWPWLVIGCAIGALTFASWWRLENHEIATAYLLLAIGVSRLGRDPAGVLRLTARMLIAGIFAFAFGWKLLSSQFISNEFFRYTLVTDPRFEPYAIIAGTGAETLDRERASVAQLAVADVGESRRVPEGAHNDELAALFTMWGLVTEGLVAVTYLLSRPAWIRRLRPAAVFTFCATTYLTVPVVGFGLLLLTLVAAESMSPRVRSWCVLGAVAVCVWGFTFPSIVAPLIASAVT